MGLFWGNYLLTLMRNLFKPILLLTIPSILILVVTFPSVLEYFMSSVHIADKSQFTNEDRGTFGDMYGVLNSFLSGLSIIGIVLTLYWDKKQEVDKEEKANIDRMSYLYSVCQKANAMLQEYQDALTKFNEELDKDPLYIPYIVIETSTEILSVINEKIDQEAYFHSYKSFYSDEQILDLFNHYAFIAAKINHSLNGIKEKTKDNIKRNDKIIGLIEKFRDANNDDFNSLSDISDKLNIALADLSDEERANSWIIYKLLDPVIVGFGSDNPWISDLKTWQIITTKINEIKKNRDSLQGDLNSYHKSIQGLLDDRKMKPVLEKIKNSNHTSFKLNSFWYFFHGKPKTN